MYFRARHYDPTTGEFVSQDPLEYVDGMSLYRGYFVPGGIDPSGRTYIENVFVVGLDVIKGRKKSAGAVTWPKFLREGKNEAFEWKADNCCYLSLIHI